MRHCAPARGPLRGTVRVPGDKSVTHRALLFAPLGDGPSRVDGWLEAEDTLRSLEAVRVLGADIQRGRGDLVIAPGSFPQAGDASDEALMVDIDCGNSGTTTRLLLGLLAGRRVRARLDGDASLRSRPMARVVEPLRAMGAVIRYLGEDGRLPLEIHGRSLTGISHGMTVASAQVKSALLLSGLTAVGSTTVLGGGRSRDHTERMLRAMGAKVTGDGDEIDVCSGSTLRAFDLDVPGDPSSAAFPLASALLVPGSQITVAGMMLNATRTGISEVFRRMGVAFTVESTGDAAGEPVGGLSLGFGPLRSFSLGGAEIPTLIDEIPMLAVLASRAAGITRIRDAADLRTKESDRIAVTAAGLRALGVEVAEHPDGMDIVGRPEGYPVGDSVVVHTHGDHRIAMAFAVAGLASSHGVELDDDDCVGVSYPGFFDDIERLQGGGAPG